MFDKQFRHDNPAVSEPEKESGRRKPTRAYLVHAAILESALHATEPDESLLQKLVRRRLVRLERVVDALNGQVIRQMPQGLLAAFETADAAVSGACEMQRRCSVIPQILETQIALKIGIQRAAGTLRAGDAVDPAEITAIGFASISGEGSIVVSDTVLGELSPNLREAASQLTEPNIDVAAHSIDWQRVPMLRLPTPSAPKSPATRSRLIASPATIVFSLGDEQFSFGSNHPVITIGRDPVNDITINDPKASRQHCKIVYQRDGYVLVDLSTNGTFLTPSGGKPQLVRKAMLNLPASGCISPGHSVGKGEPCGLTFEVVAGA